MGELQTTEVPVFRHDHIAREPVDTACFPFPELISGPTAPVVTQHVNGATNGKLRSISHNHGRSYDLILPDQQSVPWPDQYGNHYTAVTLKGNNFSRADITTSGSAPSGFLFYGLQEGDALRRVLRSSRILRAAGIDTEWIVGIGEPQLLAYEGDLLSPALYRSLLLEKKARQMPTPGNNGRLEQLAAALKDRNFFITYRAMSAAERADDLFREVGQGTQESASPLMAKAIRIFNLLAPYRQATLDSLDIPTQLPTEAQEDYLVKILPRLIGLNFGKLHRLELIHVFPHRGNINMLGGLVDLDSVRGRSLRLGDGRNGKTAFTNDLDTAAQGIVSAYDSQAARLEVQKGLHQGYLLGREFESAGPTTKLGIFSTAHVMGRWLNSIVSPAATLTPEGDKALQRFAKEEATKPEPTVPVSELATHFYNTAIRPRLALIWEQTKWNSGFVLSGDELFLTGRLPTAEELQEGLTLYLESDKITLSDDLMAEIADDLGYGEYRQIDQARRRTIRKLAAELLHVSTRRLPRLDSSLEFALHLELSDRTRQVRTGGESVLPEPPNFISALNDAFLQDVFSADSMAIVPPQDLLTLPEDELRDRPHYWFYEKNGLSRYYPKIPHDLVRQHIVEAQHTIIRAVKAPKDVLQIEYNSSECIRLMVTDGDIDTYSEEFPYKTGNESYLQFSNTRKRTAGATYAIFLVRTSTGNYYLQYNVIEKHL